MNKISIRFKHNGTGQNDIILKIDQPKVTRKFDSFYFILEDEPKNIEGAKGRFKKLIKFWIDEIKRLNHNDFTYLPIQFDENFIGSYRIQITNKVVYFEFGYLKNVKGNTIRPSHPAIDKEIIEFVFDKSSQNFSIDKGTLIINLEESFSLIN